MNYIDFNLEKIAAARDFHCNTVRYIIMRKLHGDHFEEQPAIRCKPKPRAVQLIDESVREYLDDDERLKRILIGDPRELDDIKELFTSLSAIISLKKLFDYDSWVQSYGYELSIILDIPVCTYCNRMYTKTAWPNKRQKVTRPTFDHWFPKAQYPMLALSFYNLIPSCHICNSDVKGRAVFNLDTHFHPYYRGAQSTQQLDYRFSFNLKDHLSCEPKIIANNSFSETSIKSLKLEEIYDTHEDEINDLLKLKYAYSNTYLKTLQGCLLKGTRISALEVYRLAFGTYFEEENFDRRPLSRMKRDILAELGITPTNE